MGLSSATAWEMVEALTGAESVGGVLARTKPAAVIIPSNTERIGSSLGFCGAAQRQFSFPHVSSLLRSPEDVDMTDLQKRAMALLIRLLCIAASFLD